MYQKIFLGAASLPAFLYLCHFKNLPVTLSVFQAAGRPPTLKENWDTTEIPSLPVNVPSFPFQTSQQSQMSFQLKKKDIITQK